MSPFPRYLHMFGRGSGQTPRWPYSGAQKALVIRGLITTIGYYGNKGWSGVSLNDTIKLADHENPLFVANSLYASSTMQSYSCSKFPYGVMQFFTFLGKE